MARTARSLPPALAWALILLAFHLVGIVFLDGFTLDLGSMDFTPVRYLTFATLWTVFGGFAVALLAIALARWIGAPERFENLAAQWNAVSERRFLIATSVAAFAIPLVLRLLVLHRAPLADDESAYRFGAQLLASGRLWAASPPMKLFFDQNFMINDGRLYPAFFLGWPALLAVGIELRAPDLVNPLLAAATVPALFIVLRHFVGSAWARAGLLLFVAAPFMQIAAATQMAHTACLMALTWCLAMYVRTLDEDGWAPHAGVAIAFAVAFFVRPQSALPLGLPLLVAWLLHVRRLAPERRARAALAFVIPAIAFSVLFLGVLWLQTGSPWRVAYQRYGQYIAENGYRFTGYRAEDVAGLSGFDFSHPARAVARTAVGMFRLNVDLFGWPSSFVLLVPALLVGARRAALPWWMLASFLLLLMFQREWGIDTFGPVHAFELALPILVLSAIGARALAERLGDLQAERRDAGPWQWSALSPSLLIALVVSAWVGFAPVRLEAVREVAAHVNAALRAPARAGLHHAVIFAPLPFAPSCRGVPSHFVFFRPTNDPDLRNDILWVNQLDIRDDRRLVESLPGRAGYLLAWTANCGIELRPIGTDAAAELRSISHADAALEPLPTKGPAAFSR